MKETLRRWLRRWRKARGRKPRRRGDGRSSDWNEITRYGDPFD